MSGKARIVYDLPEAEYHADPLGNSLSSSIARTLVTRSPLHAYCAHPRMGNHDKAPTEVMERGTALHSLILRDEDDIDVVDAKDWRTKAAKQQRAESRVANRVPMLAHVHAKTRLCGTEVKARLLAAGRPLAGRSEATILWPVHTDYGEIWARARLDHLTVGEEWAEIDDLKTTDDVSALACQRKAARDELGIQAAAYRAGVEAVYPGLAGRAEFRFLFAERSPPHAVRVASLDAVMRARGERLWRLACETWGRCLQTGEWPGYDTDTVIIHSPGWLAAQEATLEYEQTIHCE